MLAATYMHKHVFIYVIYNGHVYAMCEHLKHHSFCFVMFIGGRINSRDVWMYNSQLNLWIRVASLNKGRWRHKMGVLLGKVRNDPKGLVLDLRLMTNSLYYMEYA